MHKSKWIDGYFHGLLRHYAPDGTITDNFYENNERLRAEIKSSQQIEEQKQ
jgi:hypothetical protein